MPPVRPIRPVWMLSDMPAAGDEESASLARSAFVAWGRLFLVLRKEVSVVVVVVVVVGVALGVRFACCLLGVAVTNAERPLLPGMEPDFLP